MMKNLPRTLPLWLCIIWSTRVVVQGALFDVPGAAIFGNILGKEPQPQQQQQQYPQRPPQRQLPPPPPPPPSHNGTAYLPQQSPLIPHMHPSPQRIPQQQQHFMPPPQSEREHMLMMQLQNLSAVAVTAQQREELHLRQLDVLTERVMHVEAQNAREHNLLQEYQANCTRHDQEMAALRGECSEWEQRCREFAAAKDQDQLRITNLTQELTRTRLNMEDLAAMVERHRLDDLSSTQRRKKRPRRRTFLQWLFGWNSEDDEDNLEQLQDKARTTLLRALQMERNSVEELESLVASLQQNNSAISQQVHSRDKIVDELNERLAVFEEDKVVLKAALRQLQKDISEEAPRTQQLKDDLRKAQSMVEHLQTEIDRLVETHRLEVSALQQAKLERDSNLTTIGTYVDKLEERLADFAVARRDLEVRERKYHELEATSEAYERQGNALRAKLAEYELEQNEYKKLLEELAKARAELLKENSRLTRQVDDFSVASNHSRATVEDLQAKITELRRERDVMQVDMERIQRALAETTPRTQELQNQLRETEAQVARLQDAMEQRSASHKKEVESLRSSLDVQIMGKEKLITDLQTEVANLQRREMEQRREIPLPTPNATATIARANATVAIQRSSRDVPFRELRKYCAKQTGIHGLFTKPSRSTEKPPQKPQGSLTAKYLSAFYRKKDSQQ